MEVVYGRTPWPSLIFHVYGDFTLYTHLWSECEKKLRDRRVRFICASPRQRQLIAGFVRRSKDMVSVCPFPIAPDEYGWQEGLREKSRSKHGLREDEFTFVYTGRLSMQKNILKMIWDVSNQAQKLGRPWKLLLAGLFDDLGHTFFGIHLRAGAYFNAFEKCMSSLPEELKGRIQYLGTLGKADLRALYHAADLFVSFSTHHDEDYGLSPVEALCCGCPGLVTDWGGFGGFKIDERSLTMIPVVLSEQGARVESSSLPLKELFRFESEEAKRDRSQMYLEHFGLEKAARLVEDALSQEAPKFSSFTPQLKRHALLCRRMGKTGEPMFRMGRRADRDYVSVYKNYLSES
jgi:glycosyltransferase involved in cell wall biosynthesis